MKVDAIKLEVDVFEISMHATRYDAIEFLLEHARNTLRESWADFNGTVLIAKPDDTRDDVDNRWLAAQPVTMGPGRPS